MERRMTSGDFIKEAREDIGITQKDLARKIGISNQHLCNWERGAALVPGPYISVISKILKINRNVLVDVILKDVKEKFYKE